MCSVGAVLYYRLFLFIKLHCKLVLCYACGFKVRSCLLFYCFSGLLCIAQPLLVRRAAFTVISLLIKRAFAVCIEGLVAAGRLPVFSVYWGKRGGKGKSTGFSVFKSYRIAVCGYRFYRSYAENGVINGGIYGKCGFG